ncbi:DUF4402 domain-containing protein [Sphingomonas soli]|uniref:DUF4402 domain-containing protein n=1 Tax=Sphingomonas soli TaxID=266127 RepID=UPI000835B940|nr:DUF4402 domain-containing protein [Sphingomonas soli]
MKAILLALATLVLPLPALAQVSVQSVQSPAPALGAVSSASSVETVFRVSASSGTVTRLSGSGTRIGGGSTRPLVTLTCGINPDCVTRDVVVTVSSLGAPSGRMGQLDNFTVSALTAVITGSPSGTGPMSFTIAPIGLSGVATFYLGMDVPILGNDSAEATGAASAAFQVSAAFSGGGAADTQGGTATATVFRPLSIAATVNLFFGALIRPDVGSGTVTLDAITGNRALVNVGAIGPAPVRARFVVSGEGGQSFSLSMPESFEMNGPGAPLTVVLQSDAIGPSILDGSIGNSGSNVINVGGSFAISSITPQGAYAGSFEVSVAYN